MTQEYINKNEDVNKVKVFTSELKRTQQTAEHFPNKNKSIHGILNEIDSTILDDIIQYLVKF